MGSKEDAYLGRRVSRETRSGVGRETRKFLAGFAKLLAGVCRLTRDKFVVLENYTTTRMSGAEFQYDRNVML